MSLPAGPFGVITLLMLAALAAARAHAGDVTIYRCVDASGKVSLQDRPCPKDVHQDVRQMLRPQDPPPRPPQQAANPPPAMPPAPPSNVTVRVIHVRDPQPLYECRTPDGDTYLSQSGVPEARYVPLWTLGLGNGFVNVGGRPTVSPGRGGGRLPRGQFAYPMVYTQDSCVQLATDEVCRRMRERDDQLGTLIFNGQPSDRDRYERERRGLAEQFRAQCS